MRMIVTAAILAVIGCSNNPTHASVQGEPASLTIYCKEQGRPIRPGVFGVNGPDKHTDWAGNETVTRRLKEGGFKVVRVGLVQDGLYQNRDVYPRPGEWNFKALDKMLRAIFDAGAEPVLSVIGFPKGVPHELDGDKKIVRADWDEYVKFISGAVRHFNKEGALGQGRKVRYWELWNEPNDEPEGKFRSREQYALFARKVGKAIKAVDPGVRLIGPVHSWSDLGVGGWVSFGAKELGDILDVLCWHDYGKGPDDTDANRLRWPREHYGDNVRLVNSGAPDGRFIGPGAKKLDAAITEYDMAWQDGPPDYIAKFHGQYNAAYIGTSLIQAIKSDIELFCFYVFTQAGRNLLGLVDNKTYEPFLPYHVFPFFTQNLGDDLLRMSGEPRNIESVATKAKDGRLAILLVNTSLTENRTVRLKLDSLAPTRARAKVVRFREKEAGSRSDDLDVRGGAVDVSVPPLGLAVVRI